MLEAVDIAFAAAEATAIAGPNCSGKITLLRHLAGLDSAAAGQVELHGQPIAGFAVAERALPIAYLPQGGSAYWPLLGRDLVALGRLPHGLDLSGPFAPQDVDAIRRALARVDGEALADRPTDTLSQGERARLMLERARWRRRPPSCWPTNRWRASVPPMRSTHGDPAGRSSARRRSW